MVIGRQRLVETVTEAEPELRGSPSQKRGQPEPGSGHVSCCSACQTTNTQKCRNVSFLCIIVSIINKNLTIMLLVSFSKYSLLEVFFSVMIYYTLLPALVRDKNAENNSEQFKLSIKIE